MRTPQVVLSFSAALGLPSSRKVVIALQMLRDHMAVSCLMELHSTNRETSES